MLFSPLRLSSYGGDLLTMKNRLRSPPLHTFPFACKRDSLLYFGALASSSPSLSLARSSQHLTAVKDRMTVPCIFTHTALADERRAEGCGEKSEIMVEQCLFSV